MSKEEAEEIIKRWVEHKMMWFDDSFFENRYVLHQAINVIGTEEVDKIARTLRETWED